MSNANYNKPEEASRLSGLDARPGLLGRIIRTIENILVVILPIVAIMEALNLAFILTEGDITIIWYIVLIVFAVAAAAILLYAAWRYSALPGEVDETTELDDDDDEELRRPLMKRKTIIAIMVTIVLALGFLDSLLFS